MRVKIYGGPLALSYNIAKFLKKSGMDITLYADKISLDESYKPGWEDGDDAASAAWIKEIDVNLKNCFLRRAEERRFLEELKEADMLHMQGESSIWASFTDVPYVYQSYGYDLDQMPFKKDSLKARALGYLVRRSMQKAKCIIASPHQRKFLKKLGVRVKVEYIPDPIDTDKYVRRDTALGGKLKKQYKCDFIFFSPTRHEWSGAHTSNKGNDKLINAFGNFLRRSGKKALLILAEKGDDLEKSKELVRRGGLENHTLWIKPQKKDSLIDFYGASDVVFDQFTAGGFGQVFLESMSCGIPTFAHLKGYEALYADPPPCVNVSTEGEISAKLTELTENTGALRDIGRKSREWAVRYHGWRSVVGQYKRLYENILADK